MVGVRDCFLGDNVTGRLLVASANKEVTGGSVWRR